MTAMIDESAPSMVRCPCGKLVAPTVPGGRRPRPHHDDDTGARCTRYREVTAATCKRCGGPPDQPLMVRRGGRDVRCASDVFHPKTWTVAGELVGNAAACGSVLGVSGEQWLWYGREPGKDGTDTASRAPGPDGYDLERRTRFWRIAAAEAFRDQLPSRRTPAAAE